MELRETTPDQHHFMSMALQTFDHMRDDAEKMLGGDRGVSTMIFAMQFAAAQWTAQTTEADPEKIFMETCRYAWQEAMVAIAKRNVGEGHG